jgi:phosphotransferase system HPr (HPr) family protein
VSEFSYTIKDPNGIHARPAGDLVKEMQQFASDVTVSKDDKSADCKKLFALMKLRVKCGDTITVKADGADAEAAAAAAKAFLEAKM